MNKMMICASFAAVSLLGVGTAFAGGSQGSIGVGAEGILSPIAGSLSGLSINYDAGKFHAGGALLFIDEPGDDNTDIGIAGRFYWHIHSTPMSDFSIGGNLGLLMDNEPGEEDATNLMFLEPGIQLRAFIAGNVALSASAGISIGLADAEGVILTGQPTGAAGIHYYFF